MAKSKEYILMKITCPYCELEFVNRPERVPGAPGGQETVVECLYCEKPVKVKMPPETQIEPVVMVRGLKGDT